MHTSRAVSKFAELLGLDCNLNCKLNLKDTKLEAHCAGIGKDTAPFQVAIGGERRHIMCIGARSGSNLGPLGGKPSALTNCAGIHLLAAWSGPLAAGPPASAARARAGRPAGHAELLKNYQRKARGCSRRLSSSARYVTRRALRVSGPPPSLSS